MSVKLFSPLKIRSVEFRNRIFVSPMCQYSSVDGVAQAWHMVHLGARAVGGAALVLVEATGVSPEGRITLGCAGLWNKTQMEALKPIVDFMKSQGAVPGIQLAHAGRKASQSRPWEKEHTLTSAEGGWQVLAPSAKAFSEKYPQPEALSLAKMQEIKKQFEYSLKLALEAGFEVAELHMAHGYLLHEFLSPLSNERQDQYGGSLENRMRFPLEVAKMARLVWPDHLPLFVRVSASDWMDGGWTIDDSVIFAAELKKLGVDFIDCSSGGNVPNAKIPAGPSYQVPFAAAIRQQVGMLTGAVGVITEPAQAEAILQEGKADAVLLARELLRKPYWPMEAAKALGAEFQWPKQYERAKR